MRRVGAAVDDRDRDAAGRRGGARSAPMCGEPPLLRLERVAPRSRTVAAAAAPHRQSASRADGEEAATHESARVASRLARLARVPRAYVGLGSNLGDRESTHPRGARGARRRRGSRGRRRLDAHRHGARRLPGSAALPERRRRARDDAAGRGSSSTCCSPSRPGSAATGRPFRPRARGRSISTCCSTARPRSTSPGSGSPPAAPRAGLRPRAPGRARTRPSKCPEWARFRPSWRATLSLRCPTSTTWTSTRPSSSSRLKREYQAVFGLFRYCVLTPDATYLCNKLERTYAPQPAYPFSASSSRTSGSGTRTARRASSRAPRSSITTGDVTIEELRGEGDEPALTPEALAERLGGAGPPRRRRVLAAAYTPADAARGRRRQHADGLRPLRRAGARRALAHRDRGASGPATSSARSSATSSTSTRSTASGSRRPCRG